VFTRVRSGLYSSLPMCTGTDIYVDTNKILVALGKNMRLEWPVYAFSASVFFAFALSVQLLSLETGVIVVLFVLLTMAYAWVA